jgi:two-component system sensor histidine kinase KdpD
MTAARWAFQHNEPAGTGTGTLPIIPWYFIPLRIGDKILGVVGTASEKGESTLDSEGRALLETLAEQTAAAIDRAALSREMVIARSAAESEKIRNTMLASISHDFRTPLSSILGSASSLIDYSDKLDASARTDLLKQIKVEAEGLDDLVRNLLAVTRIDAGALELRSDWVDLREIAQRVVSAIRRRGAQQHFEVNFPPDIPLIQADAALIEQAIGNIVANAAAHTPATTNVVLDAGVTSSRVALNITDDGPGIAEDALPRVFDKFVTLNSASNADGGKGTGLGLAIAKGIAEAHGGTIEAKSPVADGRGARFTLRLPIAEVRS